MKKMSVREFKDFCEQESTSQYIFDTGNQSWNRVEDPLRLKLVFHTMLVAFSPNAICFRGGENSLCLQRVRNIRMTEEKTALGWVFHIVCSGLSDCQTDRTYTVVAR